MTLLRNNLIILLILLPVASLAATECIGPLKANKFIVYLHGMDSISPSAQELRNREILGDLAKDLNIRFAIPRATRACPTNSSQLCWTWAAKTSEDLLPVKKAITDAAKECFLSKNYSVLGFSNGGVAVAALLRLCEKVDYDSAIVVGAAGGWFSTDPKTIEGCYPKLILLLGSEDQANLKPVRSFVEHLTSLKAPISLVEYKGGHELIYETLARLLK